MFRRFAQALVLAGGLAAGGVFVAAIGAGVNPAAALASTAHTLSTAVLVNPTSTPAAGTSTTTPSTCPHMNSSTTTTGSTLSF
jgi:hypothetical protein